MKILINDHRKLFAIRSDFSKMFPQLELVFFARPDHQKSDASKKMIARENKTIGECRIIHNKGTITITPHITVAELEENFSSVYGLSVRVMTKNNDKVLALHDSRDIELGELNTKCEGLVGAPPPNL